ncbi:DUF4405 domain-containing protein [Undibacterium rugosum]|uniref:DUF4405 domain-containing protein n=1 Tax=Undibacterium rugosum TaxID=2762291 RepID=UPI001E383AE5|nr:DUF4405 domain-containing protein [Undibacterium rugosum]
MRTNKHTLHPHRSSRSSPQPRYRLENWHRRSLYVLFAGLTVSGLIWLTAHFFLRTVGEFGESIHPAEHWSMQVHGALIIPLVFLVGSMLFQHMRRAHLGRHNHYSGWTMLLFLCWLQISGYGLYYFASEQLRPVWSVLHWIPGLLLPGILYVHIRLGRRL